MKIEPEGMPKSQPWSARRLIISGVVQVVIAILLWNVVLLVSMLFPPAKPGTPNLLDVYLFFFLIIFGVILVFVRLVGSFVFMASGLSMLVIGLLRWWDERSAMPDGEE